MKSKSRPGKSVFIIEDDVLYGKSLQSFIQNSFSDIDDVRVFPDGETFLNENQGFPIAIIIDYYLNSKQPHAHNGIEIIKQIKNQNQNTNIIVLSSQNKPGVILEAIRDFNCRYIEKDTDSFKHIERLIQEFNS